MALEQWEIELRKQLQDAPYEKPKEKSWEDRLREQISNIPPAEPHHHPHPKKNNNNTFMAVVMILLLAGALLFAYNMKTGVISNWFNAHMRSTPTDTTPPSTNPFPDDKPGPTPPADPGAELKQLRADMEKMKQDDAARYAEIQKRLKWDHDRITLLGMLNNENWLVIRNEGPNSSNYIYFNADWTLSRQPQYLQLSEADKEFLERYRKK